MPAWGLVVTGHPLRTSAAWLKDSSSCTILLSAYTVLCGVGPMSALRCTIRLKHACAEGVC
eukprot:122038-Alexandrium_andersonii.AAC.1